MKTIHQVNKWALIVTLILYLTVYLGMAAQIFLGILQLFLAATITLKHYRDLRKDHQKLIDRYWFAASIVVAYILMVYWFDKYFVNDFLMNISLFIIPMSIACYFVYVTRQIKNRFPYRN